MKVLCKKYVKCTSIISKDEKAVLEQGADNMLYEAHQNYRWDEDNDIDSITQIVLEHMPDQIQMFVDEGMLPQFYLDTFDSYNLSVVDPDVVKVVTDYVANHYDDYRWDN